ncbi:MAG: FAD-dependent oxidoreductase [Eubacterium sp.]|nr:FAD-dependent oxidoreductase [Eubacterium sp.]
MNNLVDIAIIGSGPAGISAAINAKIRHKSFYLFGSSDLSDKVQRSECISNYPPFFDISGKDLNEKLSEHLKKAKISITEKRITGIYNMGSYFALLSDQEEFDAKSVIIATGVEAARPIKGERELLGRGVSYCATCDGNLYKGKTIAVICDNPSMEEEAEYLAALAEKVYYQPLFKESKFNAENVEILSSPVTEILGERKASGVRCRNGFEIELDGVFFLKQSVSPAVLIQGLKTDDNCVAVDRNMATNIKGCFAAGDCTGAPYQIAKAVGEGNIAAHSAFKYLSNQE